MEGRTIDRWWDMCPAESFTKNLIASPHLPIASNIRSMSFAMDRRDVHSLHDSIIEDAKRSSAVLKRLLPVLSGLRQFRLLYIAQRENIDSHRREGYIHQPPPYYTSLYLEEIDLSALSQLPDLRKVLITGTRHMEEEVPSEEDKESHIRAITERARQLKSTLRGEVKVCVQFLCWPTRDTVEGEEEIEI
jgi:hypothetical protein